MYINRYVNQDSLQQLLINDSFYDYTNVRSGCICYCNGCKRANGRLKKSARRECSFDLTQYLLHLRILYYIIITYICIEFIIKYRIKNDVYLPPSSSRVVPSCYYCCLVGQSRFTTILLQKSDTRRQCRTKN